MSIQIDPKTIINNETSIQNTTRKHLMDLVPYNLTFSEGHLDAAQKTKPQILEFINKKEFTEIDIKNIFECCNHDINNEINVGSRLGSACIIAATSGQGPFLYQLLISGVKLSSSLWELMIYHSLNNLSEQGLALILLAYCKKNHIKINPDFEKNKDSLLMKAASSGNVLLVRYMLDLGANPNYLSIEGESCALDRALKATCFEENILEIVTELIERGAKINLKFNNTMLPLYYSLVYKKMSVFSFLLEKATLKDFNDKSNEKQAHLFSVACALGRFDAVAMIFKKFGNKFVELMGHEAIFCCIVQSRPEMNTMIYMLIKLGANLNERNQQGETLLEYALRLNRFDTFEILRNANALETDLSRRIVSTPLGFKKQKKMKNLKHSSESSNVKDYDEIQQHINHNNSNEIYEVLIKNVLTQKQKDRYLVIAIVDGKRDIAQLFLAAGADIEYFFKHYKLSQNELSFNNENEYNIIWRTLEETGININTALDNKQENIVNLLIQAMLDNELAFLPH